jgi:hypothetical protein
MMTTMIKLGAGWAGLAAGACCALALSSCGGQTKQAESAGTCPEGTVLRGSDCLPAEAAPNDKSTGDKATADKATADKATADKATADKATADKATADKPAEENSTPPSVPPKVPAAEEHAQDHVSAAPTQSDSAAAGKTPYDKEAVDAQLKRGARQVKANCGAATDDEGKATGPWGKTKASITLGRNGHVKQVSVPAPYDGKPAGLCVLHSFEKIQFPPYPGESDVVVDWDVELVRPKH